MDSQVRNSHDSSLVSLTLRNEGEQWAWIASSLALPSANAFCLCRRQRRSIIKRLQLPDLHTASATPSSSFDFGAKAAAKPMIVQINNIVAEKPITTEPAGILNWAISVYYYKRWG
jgi:hypothetical protein